MAKILNGFQTTSGGEWLKKEDSAGRTYYVKKGDGRVSREQYAAANRHFDYALKVEGELPPELRDAGSLDALERMTNIPFSQDFVQAIRGRSADSKAEKRRAEGNRWVGFREAQLERRPDMSDEQIAKEYLKFRREIEQAETEQARAIIKEQYNLGGS